MGYICGHDFLKKNVFQVCKFFVFVNGSLNCLRELKVLYLRPQSLLTLL